MVEAKKRKKNKDTDSLIETFWQVKADLPGKDFVVSRLSASVLGHVVLAPASRPSIYSFKDQTCVITGCHFLLPQQSPLFLHQPSNFSLSGAELALGTSYLMAKKKVIAQNHNSSRIAEPISVPNPDCKDFNEVINSFNCYLSELRLHEHTDRHYLLCKKIEHLLGHNPHQQISELASQLNMSQRTLERSFLKVVGVSLKTYQNISRFNKFLENFVSSTEQAVRGLNGQYYFYDQSHCIRQFNSYVGVSPKHLLKHDDLVSSRYSFKNF